MPPNQHEYDEYSQDFPERDRSDEYGRREDAREQVAREQDTQFEPLILAFREQLIACLEACAAGRRGLFTDLENESAEADKKLAWPEAARLRELAFALQSILAQSEKSDPLCDQFLDLCSIHGESDPGEPRLARAFLAEIQKGA
jgi:hypothetical protein